MQHGPVFRPEARTELLVARPGAALANHEAVLTYRVGADPLPLLIEAGSLDGLPFELLILWGSGGDSARPVRVTVPVATLVCIHATSVVVKAANLDSGGTNRVSVTCYPVDQYRQTRNQYILTSTGAFGPTAIPIPVFATHARIEVGNAAGTATIATIDGLGNTVGTYDLTTIPEDGIPLAGLRELSVTVSHASRLVFTLAL